MAQTPRILLAGRSAEAIEALRAGLADCTTFSWATRLISNGHTDPLAGVQPTPDALVLRFDPESLV